VSTNLVARLRSGDADALDDVLKLYGAEVSAVAYAIVRDRTDAEDVTEETFVIAWRKIGSLRDDSALRAWLLTIAARLAARRRIRPRELPLHDSLSRGWIPDVATRVIERDILDRALRALPAGMRTVVALHYIADLSVDEVARTIGRSPNTVKSQLRSALRQLRESLAADGQP
jgi:RNA polymerase sigma-70 factor (ECF subfamily)